MKYWEELTESERAPYYEKIDFLLKSSIIKNIKTPDGYDSQAKELYITEMRKSINKIITK